MISHLDYIACLPDSWRARAATPPESTWWPWRDLEIHVARVRQPAAAKRLVVLHGAGGHSGALWPPAALAADLGYDVLAPDLPGYGLTRVPRPGSVRYPQWIDCMVDWLDAERRHDPRPIVLVGASIGGMLAYSVAARCEGIAHVVVTCLLDPRQPTVRAGIARTPWLGRIARPTLRAMAPLTDDLRVPIRWMTPMTRIANQARLSRLCVEDPRGGGSRISLGFLRSYLESTPACEPEAFTLPLTLAHSGADRWTPPSLSLPFFERLAGPREYLVLGNAGHFPVESPGIDQLYALFSTLMRAG